jgi:hypothetical protein
VTLIQRSLFGWILIFLFLIEFHVLKHCTLYHYHFSTCSATINFGGNENIRMYILMLFCGFQQEKKNNFCVDVAS